MPSFVRRQLGRDVVVARERVGLEVLHPVLDPLHRLAGEHRGGDRDHVAGVHRHLAAEAAADVRRDDPDLVLGEPDVPGHEREHGADRVRRLRRHPHRELVVDLVEVRDAAARLDRRHVDARDVDVLLDGDVGLGEGAVGGGPIAPFPVPDVVVLLVLLVGAEHGRAGLERLLRIDDDGQRLVLHLDRGRRRRRRRSGWWRAPPPPPAPGTSPSRPAAPSACPTSASASSAGCTSRGPGR